MCREWGRGHSSFGITVSYTPKRFCYESFLRLPVSETKQRNVSNRSPCHFRLICWVIILFVPLLGFGDWSVDWNYYTSEPRTRAANFISVETKLIIMIMIIAITELLDMKLISNCSILYTFTSQLSHGFGRSILVILHSKQIVNIKFVNRSSISRAICPSLSFNSSWRTNHLLTYFSCSF